MEKEVTEVERKLFIKQSYIRKIDIELKKEFSDSNELFLLIKGFFSELLKLDYEFTYEELSQELDKAFLKLETRRKIDMLLQTLTELNYFKSLELSVPETKSFLKTLREIVDESIIDESRLSKTSFFEKLFKKEPVVVLPSTTKSSPGALLSAEPLVMPAVSASSVVVPESSPPLSLSDTTPVVDAPAPLLHDHTLAPESLDSSSQELYLVIEQAYAHLDEQQIDAARMTYLHALDIYRHLSSEGKKSVFFKVYALYEKLNA